MTDEVAGVDKTYVRVQLSACTGMICAIVVDPRFDLYILTPVTLKSRLNRE